MSGPLLSTWSFAPRKSCHLAVSQVLLESKNVLKSMAGKDGSRSEWMGKETIMKFLLTSSGISNDSIRNALVESLGKPIAESGALCIPTAAYACPGGAAMAWRFLRGVARSPLCEVGWKSLGVLELTALPSIDEERWLPLVQETDALLVYGGDVLYLCYWMRQSGLADLLPELSRETVYVGVSAGSMVVTPNFG